MESIDLNRGLLTRLLLVLALIASVPKTWAFPPHLSQADVQTIIAQAATRAVEVSPHSVIAVVDREGYVLAVWDVDGGDVPPQTVIAGAISRAGTAAFLSSDQNAFTSRTAGYIIQQHFPPGVRNTPPGPLVGVGLSNVAGYSDVNFMKQVPGDNFDPNSLAALFGTQSPGTFGGGLQLPIPPHPLANPSTLGTSLNDSAGGVPLYKQGRLVGGVGVIGDPNPIKQSTGFAIFFHDTQKHGTPGFREGPDNNEDVALSGQIGFDPPEEVLATHVLLGGIRIPYVETDSQLAGTQSFGTIGKPVPSFPVRTSPPTFDYPTAELGGTEGEIRFPFRDDPMPGKIGKASRLTAGEVEDIIGLAAERSRHTRAGIRLPVGTAAKVFISVVGNPNHDDVPAPILGIFRTGEATIFSWDVSVQKARTALFFSNNKFAQSSRTVGFLAQRFYPPGIDGMSPGPYFGIQEALFINVLKAVLPKRKQLELINKNLPNGITIFPGGFPLYREGRLVGAVGVSGDGVDQDDIIGISGATHFAPPARIRADQYIYHGARLPYVKFPRDPEL
jgi:uncharacterized protein GlcG (DUF336 family)